MHPKPMESLLRSIFEGAGGNLDESATRLLDSLAKAPPQVVKEFAFLVTGCFSKRARTPRQRPTRPSLAKRFGFLSASASTPAHRRRRGGSPFVYITRDDIAKTFNMTSEDACRKLGVGLTVLKRLCRKFGITRWPYRKVRSIDSLITSVRTVGTPFVKTKIQVKSVAELRAQKEALEAGNVSDLDDNTKRLQQAFSKALHKARRTEEGKAAADILQLTHAPPAASGLQKPAASGLQKPAASGLQKPPASGRQKPSLEHSLGQGASVKIIDGGARIVLYAPSSSMTLTRRQADHLKGILNGMRP